MTKLKIEMIHVWRTIHAPKKHSGEHAAWYVNTYPEKFK